MDWQALLHNKWALGGVAVAAAAGGFVLYRRHAAGGASGGGSGAVGASNASPAYTGGGVGGFDSTGTDVASWLGSYSGNLQNQLDAFAAQQSDFLAALSQMQAAPPATGGGSEPPGIRHPRTAPPVPPRRRGR